MSSATGQIWFACKQCGRRDSRPESQAGSLVFCTCGQGNRVPWSSTIAEDVPAPPLPPRLDSIPLPAAVPVPVPTSPARPRAVPILEAVPVDTPPARPAVPVPPPAIPADTLPSRRPGRLVGKVNPAFCFQHDEEAAQFTCDACRLPFCTACVVSLQGETLCGPCKNFRVASRGRAVRPLPLAVIALVLSLVSAPVAFILSLVGVSLYLSDGLAGGAAALCLIGVALPITGTVLGIRALLRIEGRPGQGGQAAAASAACAGLIGTLWCLTVFGLVLGKRLFI